MTTFGLASPDRWGATAAVISVLGEQPQLEDGVTESELALARRASLARVVSVPAGVRLRPSGDGSGGPCLALLSGWVVHRVSVGRWRAAHLLGARDVLRCLPEGREHRRGLERDVSFEVRAQTRLVVFDEAFRRRTAPWPHIWERVVRRADRSSEALIDLALCQSSLGDRIHLLLWSVAQRWGDSGPDPASISLPLSHELLAEMVAARRPSVTRELKRLAEQGRVQLDPAGCWLVTEPAGLAAVAA